MSSDWIALSNKLLLELAALDSSEINLPFSANEIFRKFVTHMVKRF